ncbi:hypothetical protein C0995_010839 [Termitomyces sp. Mi166|nr:hypothetical protein C0995_010839 [Termitomyces sp. Mi166\
MLLRLHAIFLFAASACSALQHPDLTKRNSTGLTDAVTWDSHSLFIHSQRIFILSAEVHPWRLPGNPDLWADVLQKIKSNGFNTVSFYVNWAVHYPTPTTNGGQGDFQEGTYRDIQRFIDEAKKAGLWMIARPGPYINGETTGGGFPGWVGNIAGNLRTNNPNYQEAWTPYMTSISQLIAKNQITTGGPIQAENEFSASANNNIYMQAIIDLYRANGIVQLLTMINMVDKQEISLLIVPGLMSTYTDNVFVLSGDSYPQGANNWAQVQAIYYSAHAASAPSNPLCLAEYFFIGLVKFGGGFLLGWGAVPRGGTGYEKYSVNLTNADYGINENRVATSKMNEMRLQGLFLRVSRDLLGATLIANGTNYTSSRLIHTAELRNLDNGAAFYIIRQNASTSTALTTTRLTVDTSIGQIVVPKSGDITFNGRESKILVTDYVFGCTATRILYSTADLGKTDYIVFYGPPGQIGETAFRFTSVPVVSTSSSVSSGFTNGTLIISYSLLSGSQFITIQSTNQSTVVVIVLDKITANTWHAPVIAGEGDFGQFFSIGTNQRLATLRVSSLDCELGVLFSVIVAGPYVVRTAEINNDTLALTGDLNGTTTIEFLAPPNVDSLTWNGVPAALIKNQHGMFSTSQHGRSGIALPALSNWKVLGR